MYDSFFLTDTGSGSVTTLTGDDSSVGGLGNNAKYDKTTVR